MTNSPAAPERHPACVLLHSSMSSRSQWSALMAQQESRLHCIAPDLLGYGKAPFPDPATHAAFSLEHEVQALLATLDGHLQADEPFHLVGHSYGGATALRLARHMPERILSLTLFEPVAFHLLAPGNPARAEIAAVIARIDAAASPREGAQAFIDYWNGAGAFAALPEGMQQRFTGLIAKVRLDFVALLGEPATLADMAALDIPTLLLFGRDGPLSTRTVAEELAAALPRVVMRRTPGGHMAPLTHAADVNAVIGAFLAAATEA